MGALQFVDVNRPVNFGNLPSVSVNCLLDASGKSKTLRSLPNTDRFDDLEMGYWVADGLVIVLVLLAIIC